MNELEQTLDKDVVIRAEQLTKKVCSGENELTILSELSFNIKRAETVAIVGASGVGKSTLLGLLAGLDSPSKGVVYLNQQNLTLMNEEGRARARARQVGFIFQNFQLLPSLTAVENVMLPLELNAVSNPKQIAEAWLEKVGLSGRGHHYPQQLSGGEQQRVAIARAFAAKPDILFADEPTGNLDAKTGQKIIELLFDLNKIQGTTLVIVTHDKVLAGHCQRVIAL